MFTNTLPVLDMEERLIPIDIKDVKLLEWLVNRSLVNRLWNEECGELRKLIAEVLLSGSM